MYEDLAPRRHATCRQGLLIVFMLCAFTAFGCERRPEAPYELETEELSAGPTDALTAEGDAREERGRQGPAGLVPADFPKRLTLPEEASVAGFGELSESRRYLDLDLSGLDSEAVSSWMNRSWSSWQRSGSSWSRDGVTVSVTLSELPFGTRMRIDYPAQIIPAR